MHRFFFDLLVLGSFYVIHLSYYSLLKNLDLLLVDFHGGFFRFNVFVSHLDVFVQHFDVLLELLGLNLEQVALLKQLLGLLFQFSKDISRLCHIVYSLLQQTPVLKKLLLL